MASIISFGRSLGRAIFDEAVNTLPAIVCAASSLVTPVIPAVAQTAASIFSLKTALAESRTAAPWTHKTVKVLYHTGIGSLMAMQMFSPTPESTIALAAVATGIGATKLYRGFHQTKKGIFNEFLDSKTREDTLAKGIVSTIVGSFSVLSGLSKISSSLPSFKYHRLVREARKSDFNLRFLCTRGLLLFSSTIWRSHTADPNLAKLTLAAIQKTSHPGITFSEENMLPWKNEGLCSAKALDFIARYIEKCPTEGLSFVDQLNCISGFANIYNEADGKTSVFASRQAAFDSIQVDANHSSEDAHMLAKIASLGAFHNLKFQGATESVPITKLDYSNGVFDICLEPGELEEVYEKLSPFISKEQVEYFTCERNDATSDSYEKRVAKIVDELPLGHYVFRGIVPEDNHKLEDRGHSMAFVKSSAGSFFFNPSRGLDAIIRRIGPAVSRIIRENNYWVEKFRIYKVSCGEEGCTNLAP